MKKRLVTSYQQPYITTPIENQLSIYYSSCGDQYEARGKEFIFGNDVEWEEGTK